MKLLRACKGYIGVSFPRCLRVNIDNGTEFSNAKAVEEMGIKYFYAHSYCSYERGSNENNNKLIRRLIVKGVDIGKWNLFDGLSSNQVYKSLEKTL